MKILIDIGHPAHVHYFKNLIKIMEEKGHDFLVVARDKEVTHKLLHSYDIDFKSRGKGRQSLIGKVFYTFQADVILLKLARKWKPNLLLSFGSPYAAHVAKLLRKPHIALTDTEHASLGILAFAPFSDIILTPDCFLKSFSNKQIRFKGYFELCYLSPKYFTPIQNIRNMLNVSCDEKIVLFRYISWGASHDIGQTGIPDNTKLDLIKLFEKRGYKIFISAEGSLLGDFEKYRISISPELIHSILSEADMFIGESGTMATEAAILGTPSVFVNSLDAGVFQDEVKYELLYSYRDASNLIKKINSLLEIDNLKKQHLLKRKKLLNDKINVTAFMVWFIENYPKSFKIMKENPDYQYTFK